MTTAWVVLPTYNERENLDDRRRRSPEPRSRAATRPSTAPCWSSTTARPTGPASSPTRSPPSTTTSACSTAPRKGGLGGAYLAGFDAALARGADYVFEMDADLSHDPADLPRLIDAARRGADVVLGSRYVPGGGVEGWSLRRRLLSRAAAATRAIVLGLPLPDLTGGFKCFRARRAAGARPRPRPQPRLRVPDRADLPGRARRARDRGDPDRVPRARARALQDVAPRSRSRRCGVSRSCAWGRSAGPRRHHAAGGAMTAHADELDRRPRPRRRVRADGGRRRAARRRRAGDAVRRRARRGRDLRPPRVVARRRRSPPGRSATSPARSRGWAIGRAGGRPFIERHGRWLHLGPQRFRRAERWFARYGSAFVLFGRLTPLVRSFVSIPAGALEFPLRPLRRADRRRVADLVRGVRDRRARARQHWDSVHHAFRYADYAAVALLVAGAARCWCGAAARSRRDATARR